jgi:hypothetical protein
MALGCPCDRAGRARLCRPWGRAPRAPTNPRPDIGLGPCAGRRKRRRQTRRHRGVRRFYVVGPAKVQRRAITPVAASARDADPIATARTLGRVLDSLPARAIVYDQRALVGHCLGSPSLGDRQLAGDRSYPLLVRHELRIGLGLGPSPGVQATRRVSLRLPSTTSSPKRRGFRSSCCRSRI